MAHDSRHASQCRLRRTALCVIVTGITVDQFRDAVQKASVDYDDNLRALIGTQYSATRFSARVVLKTTGNQMGLPSPELAPGQRRSSSGFNSVRRINAVCWHGYRDVLIAVFDAHPDAKVRTALAKYLGKESFYREFPATGDKNIGSQMYPARMPDLCDCDTQRRRQVESRKR